MREFRCNHCGFVTESIFGIVKHCAQFYKVKEDNCPIHSIKISDFIENSEFEEYEE